MVIIPPYFRDEKTSRDMENGHQHLLFSSNYLSII